MSLTSYQTNNRGEITKIIYNDRAGCALAYYEPIPSSHMSILNKAEKMKETVVKTLSKPTPTNKRSSYIANRKISDVIKEKDQQSKIEQMHETYLNAKKLFKQTREFDFNRREMLAPEYKNRIYDRAVDDIIQIVNETYEDSLTESRRREFEDLQNLKSMAPSPSPANIKKSPCKILPTLKAQQSSTSSINSSYDRKIFSSFYSQSDNHEPSTLILDVHRKYDDLMHQRRVEADLDVFKYSEMLRNIDRGIVRLSKGFEAETNISK